MLLVVGLALHDVDLSAAQDSLKQKGMVWPFAVPDIVEAEPPPPQPPVPPVVPEALASSAAATIHQLKNGIDPEDWRRRHPGEVEQLYQPELALVDGASWCIRFTHRWTIPHGRAVTRHAYFFPPTANDVLNPMSSPPGVQQCRLGAVWLALQEPDTIAGDSLAMRLKATLANQFPVVSETLPVLTRWPARRNGTSWRSGPRLVEIAYRPPIDWNDWSHWQGELVTVASFPLALEDKTEQCYPYCNTEDSSPAQEVDTASSIIRQVAAIGGLRAARLAPVLQLLDEIRPVPSSDTLFRVPAARLVGVLRRWLADSGRSVQQRAATLLVADRILTLSWSSVDRSARNQLTALGADIVDLHSDVLGFGYGSNWRQAAYALDPWGSVGALAMGVMIRDNFFSLRACRPDGYTEVIRLVQPFLATPAGTRSALAQLAMADAYRDMLTLASGGASESVQLDERLLQTPLGELRKVRRLALAHYRAAFAIDSTSARVRESKQDALRLQVGLLPTQTRYACTDD